MTASPRIAWPAILRQLRAVLRLGAIAAAALGLLVVVVTVTPLVSWWARLLGGPWDDPGGDVLVVLGGSVLEDGFLGEGSYWRSVYAVRAWRDGGFSQVLLSGGGGRSTPIVEPIRNFLQCHGVPASAIHMEARSRSTRENALYSKEVLAGLAGRKVLLTSDYHMFRAQRAFRKVGVDVAPRPYGDMLKRGSTWRGRWPAFLSLIGETVKIVYYFARGWI
jgi:uncharacterized SAM-binding protein YcdF (DUF218 family)